MDLMMNDECGIMNDLHVAIAYDVDSSLITHHSSFRSDLSDEEETYERNRLALIAIEELP